MIEPLLLTTARLTTFQGTQQLTNATGFYFERDNRLFLVTSRHVLADYLSRHFPDRIELELHPDPSNVVETIGFSIYLYRNGDRIWREGSDSSGLIDIAALEIDRTALPPTLAYRAFGPQHLVNPQDPIEVGAKLLVIGFPLGFHDTLHHMPVARHAIIASSFGLRFQGEGYFLTDGRTHRGLSGAPVVCAASEHQTDNDLHWLLLGVHSSRIDVGTRDLNSDEALGLNSAWYADVLTELTA